MNELRALLALELRSLYSINKFRHTKDKKEKGRFRLLLAAMVILLVTVFFYVGGLVYGLCFLGLEEIVPAYLAVLSSLLILVFGLFTAGHRIFGLRGYDLLASMPVKTYELVLSRFLSLYAEDLVLTLVIMLPGLGAYGFLTRPSLGFYLMAVPATVLAPAIPLVISAMLGTAITAVSSRMKSKSLVQTVLMVLPVIGVLVGSFSLEGLAQDFDPAAFSQLAQVMGDAFGRLYPPALWLGNGLIHSDVVSLGLFCLVSLGVLGIAIFIVSAIFHPTVSRLGNISARHDYKIQKLESRGLLKALYIREAKRYFSSSIYVTNTVIGPILGLIMAVALAVSGLDAVQSAIPLDIAPLIPYAFAGVFCMMTATCTSISMEGKTFWVVKALPIPTKTLLDSKLLLNLSLMLPCYLLAEIALMVGLQPNFGETLLLWLIPGAVTVFSLVFGITVNLKFHSFDWEKEETVVKQSLPAALGGFSGFLLAVVMGAIQLMLPGFPAGLLSSLLVLAAAALLYRKNNRAVLAQL